MDHSQTPYLRKNDRDEQVWENANTKFVIHRFYYKELTNSQQVLSRLLL